MNSKLYCTNKSGIKNVCWNKKEKKWVVKLQVNKNRIHFGMFEDIELAELVATEARDKYHKTFARHK
jgi:hypothetical protein